MSSTTTIEGAAGAFCAACLSSSNDESPGDVRTNNGIGRKFYGSADKCPTCGSVVRTLWFVVADVPIFPRGSYRYKDIGDEKLEGFFVQSTSRGFLARRTATNWNQVATTWVIGVVLAVVVMILITKLR